jgi:hypothetical protein
MEKMLLIPWVALAGLCACATAQPPSQPLLPGQQASVVSVDLTRVANDIAHSIGADANKMPLAVQVPASVAAQVCGIDINLLRIGGAPTCTAGSTSPALNQMVQQQMQSNTGAGTSASGTDNAANRLFVVVSVDVSNVASEIARGLKIDAGRVPGVVQVPLDVAAKACAVDADTLAQQQAAGSARCVATSTSDALNRQVQRHMQGQNRP